jgi:hypothetical protein
MPRKVSSVRPSFLDSAAEAPPLVARVSIRVSLQGKRGEGEGRVPAPRLDARRGD